MTRLLCVLLTLLFFLSGPAMGENSDFCPCSVAAKTAPSYVQMEFAFARGASVQTPGVTMAGETFVRVGATEASTGIRAGSYAMPEATFNAIGRDPLALKNALDLPGAAPNYFRTFTPAPGTPIQRGIVPGGEFVL